MKGIVFTELLELVEDQFGLEVADTILERSKLQSGGIYTAVGTYDHNEVLELVTQLSQATGAEIGELVAVFGEYLFGRLAAGHPSFFESLDDTFQLLENVEGYIHVEVRKLYEGAELPTIETERPEANQLIVTYQSTRPFAQLALGLIKGCIAHFGEEITIECEDVSAGAQTSMRFHLRRGSA